MRIIETEPAGTCMTLTDDLLRSCCAAVVLRLERYRSTSPFSIELGARSRVMPPLKSIRSAAGPGIE